MSTVDPFSSPALHSFEYRPRQRQRQGSVTGATSSPLSNERTDRESRDVSRHRPASICGALEGRSAEIVAAAMMKAGKRMTAGMGLREQEQVRYFSLHQ